MSHVILSGAGGSANWFPLVYPLIAVVIIYYCVEFCVKQVKKWRHRHGAKLSHHLPLEHLNDGGDGVGMN